ncbi:hypothetical protein AMAG_20218 [Allomyces macrogynus ATCC 38327]|uniref:Uncharacterized protein n=1 Tax=Allomyces macrogynus (strain ATCC 38327) TaxID=578462 RepID=A0A0L0T5T1_ALLM3|nr:hypothetical protein AMAG_20218 [Allomyces macrogynus ATCC 38327]|eukprot:KNE70036.1 hypothetical protein AMAG_20218 [Allomyces macrogynus ATCC 38327]
MAATPETEKNADVAALVADIGARIESTVSRDTLLAHLVLLTVFHRQLCDNANEVKDFSFLCAAETRYLTFMDAMAKAVIEDASLVEEPPLPPVDVALIWHSHLLSPIRYADDVQRRYGRAVARVSFPLQRMAKALMGKDRADMDMARAFWAAHLPADMSFDLTLANVSENAVTARVVCPSCSNEQELSMYDYVAFRKHAQTHSCTSCGATFTAEHVAVRRFLTIVAHAPTFARIAGTQTHPKTLVFRPDDTANMADLALHLDKSTWNTHVAKLPALSTWTDVELTMTETVVRAGHGAVHRAVIDALAQYPKFLALMVARPGVPLVPTQFIDLAWHTHQLHAAAYAKDTVELTGKVANHDDSDDDGAKARIVAGAERTAEAWNEVFGEDYYRPNVLRSTTGGSVVDAASCDACDECGDTAAAVAVADTAGGRCFACVFCDVAVLDNCAAACRCVSAVGAAECRAE